MSTYQDERIPFPSPGRLRRELRLRRPPFWLVVVLFVVVVLTWLPLALILRARVSFKDDPRIQPIQDMGKQAYYGPQEPSDVFADGRAMRLPPPGTVARDEADDPHLTTGMIPIRDDRGKTVMQFATTMPEAIPVDERLLRRGGTMYATYCAMCHGHDGYGNGAINARAIDLKEPGWVAAMSLHEQAVVDQPDGYLFSAITNGVRTMPPHGAMIRREDRWAIVAYLRVLQRSQRGTIDDVPPEIRVTLESQQEQVP